MSGEISYDLVMEEDMSFMEGTFRVGPGPWSVFIFSKRAVERPVWEAHTWESGVTGLVFHVPLAASLNTGSVEALLSGAIGCDQWQRVNGPDSMVLRRPQGVRATSGLNPRIAAGVWSGRCRCPT